MNENTSATAWQSERGKGDAGGIQKVFCSFSKLIYSQKVAKEFAIKTKLKRAEWRPKRKGKQRR